MAEQVASSPAAVGRSDAAEELRADARWRDAIRSTIGLWLIVLLIYLPVMVARHRGSSLVGLALDASTVVVSMGLAALVFVTFRRSVGWTTPLRLIALAAAVIGAAAGQAGYDLLLAEWLRAHPAASWPDMASDFLRGYSGLMNDATVFAVNAGLFHLAYDRRRDRRRERRLVAMEAAGQRAELEALRFRLNPHFLFNTLNGISAMIVTRRLHEADEMVDRLSAFLRASLDGPAATFVTVEQELAVVEHYARIEQFRFGDRLEIGLAMAPEAADRRLPPLLVQQLVEVAVEAAARTDRPARVAVSASLAGDRLQVVIDHPHLEMACRHLAAARTRVAGYAGAEVVGEPGRTRLRLPADGALGEAA